MGYPMKAERNAAIVAAYLAGKPILNIAADYGISESRTRFIIERAGALGSHQDRRARHSEINRRNQARPEVKQRKSDRMREHWRSNPNMGKARLFADDPERRAEYLLLREACGAAYARQAMGLERVA